MQIESIRKCCELGSFRWTNHVLMRLMQRNISMADVKCALGNGEIIERYPTDYPYPSCLVLGMNLNRNQLHIVCGDSGTELWLITAYFPDKDEWADDFKSRRESR